MRTALTQVTHQLDPVVHFIRASVLPQLDAPRAVLLVGSHAEGNATAASDIDLIIVTTPSSSNVRVRKEELEIDGHVVSIDFLDAGQLSRRIKRLDSVYRSGKHVTDGLATRIADAIVIHDTGVARSLIDEAKRYRPSAETLHEIARVSLTYYQDTMGSLDERDPETAIVMARQAATIAVDCFLLERGFRSLKPKWHLRRLRSAGASRVLARYQRVLGMDESSDQLRAAAAFAELDRLLCEVLQIEEIQQFEQSPLWARS